LGKRGRREGGREGGREGRRGAMTVFRILFFHCTSYPSLISSF